MSLSNLQCSKINNNFYTFSFHIVTGILGWYDNLYSKCESLVDLKKKKIDRHESGMDRQMGGQMGADKQT